MKARYVFNFLIYILLVVAMVGLFEVRANPNAQYFVQSLLGIAPCQKPIQYSIGELDSQFGLSKDNFLKALSEAASIWDTAANEKLFSYSASGSLKINLVYDYRQSATEELQNLTPKIDQSRVSYQSLKTQYDRLKNEFTSQKQALDLLVTKFNTDKQNYESSVQYWNSKGGAPKNQYQSLAQAQQNLQATVSEINRKQNDLNSLVQNLNALVDPLNQAAKQINADVSTYNKIGATTGPEFNEGLYISDSSGQRINIYQYNDQNQLVRVLAHELGHALGLDHVSNPKAIMYEFNQAENLSVTKDDLSQLKVVCHITN